MPSSAIAVYCMEQKLIPLSEAYLSSAERARIAKISDESMRELSLASACFVRQILGLHLKKDPSWFLIERNNYGQPLIRNPSFQVFFSVTHSQGLIAIAICEEHPIGLDIEKVKVRENFAGLLSRIACESEKFELSDCQNARSPSEAFYSLWTLKEAVLKSMGRGFASPMNSLVSKRLVIPEDMRCTIEHPPSHSKFDAQALQLMRADFKCHLAWPRQNNPVEIALHEGKFF